MGEDPKVRRAAVIRLGADEIARLINLPEGWSVTGVRDDFLTDSVMIRLTGPDAPTCVEGACPYEIRPEFHYEPPSEGAPEGTLGTITIIVDWAQIMLDTT